MTGEYYDELRDELESVGLTELEADVAVEYYVIGRSTGDIANRRGVERGTISSKLRRIREKREEAEEIIPEMERRIEVLDRVLDSP